MRLPVGPWEISGWSIDSRTLAPGDLFIALRGPRHDGHDYVAAAMAAGAVGCLVERPVDAPFVQVPDTQQALEELGRQARRQWGGPLVAVTGSAGKTTTKEILAAALGVRWRTAKTAGNLNNHIGVPLTLLRIPEDAEVAVVEMGMNHAGEIRHLAAIACPNIGVVTNVGWAHIENFDSQEGIAAAKRELIESLPPTGVAVLNADDARVREFRHVHPGPVVLYGCSPDADVRATDLELSATGSHFVVDSVRFTAPLAGRHAVLNLLAGIAVARLLEVPLEAVARVYTQLEPPRMRGERLEHRGIQIINDCYNANPDAVRAMLDVLRDSPGVRKLAVLGEMLELGRWAEPLHRDLGFYAVAQGITVLAGIGGAARCMVEAAREAGLPSSAAPFFSEPGAAGDWLRGVARPGDVILFKGSRGARVEIALERFLA